MITSEFIRKNKDELLQEISNKKFAWQGYQNGDSITKFQGRKLKQMAMVLLLVGEEMEMEEKILQEEVRRNLFYDFVRYLTDEKSDSSGTSELDFNIIGNLWKII